MGSNVEMFTMLKLTIFTGRTWWLIPDIYSVCAV